MADEDPPNDDDRVGPGRPPKHSRFKPGESGNPRGRPKGSVSFATIIKREARKKVKIRENGRTKSISGMEVVARQAMQQAMKGNLKATALVIQEADKVDDAATIATSPLSTPNLDTNAMRRIAERFLRNSEEDKDDEPS